MRTALIVATLFVVAASISAQRRPTKIDATDAAEVTQRAVRGRGRARFVKTPEFAQAVTEQERTTPKVAKKQNAPIARRLYEVEEVVDDIPEATRRIAKPRVITETKFEATNAPKTKLFEPAPVAAETAPPEELIKAFGDVPDKDVPEDVDITTMQLEMDEVEKISSTSSSTTTTTTTPAPSTEAPSSRRGSNQRRGQRPTSTTESASTAARSRTRVRTNRKQEDSSESTTSSSRSNFRTGRRRPEKETLRGRGPSILENDEDVSPKPRNERRTGSQRRKVEVSTTTEQIEPQKTRARTSASRGRKVETQAPASTRQPSRRRINTRPDTVKESVKPVEASTTPRPERASRGRSRTRFNVVDETKLEVLPLFEAEPKVVPRTSSRRGRTRAPVDEFVASSTVENPIRHAPPPTSTSRSVTISSRQNKITTETKQVTEKPMTKETVQSEVSEGISTRKVVRRKKVEVKKKLLDRGTTKSEVQLTNVKSKEDSDEVNETDNYPPQFKALIQAKTKEEKVKKASRIAHTERIVASVPTVAPKPSSTSTTPSRKERVTQRSTTASTTISTTTTTTTSSPPTKKHTSTKSRKPLRYSTESVITPIKTVTANYPSVVPTTTGPPPTKKATTAKSRKPLRHSKEFEKIPAGPFKTSTAIYPSIPPTPVITFRSSSQRSQPRSSLRTSQKPSSTTSNIPSTSSTTSSTTTTTTSTTTIRPSTAAVLPSSSPIPFNVEDDENELAATPKTPRRRFSTKRREYKPDAPLKLRIDQPEVTSKRPAARKTSGRYHARFVAKSEEGVEKTSPKPSARPTFTRKSIKHEERKPIPRSNKIDGNTQLPQVTVKKTNRYSSRYRGETRSTPVRASTATPAYVPTVPTVTPSGQQVRGIQGELDGFPVISIDEPVNSLYSDNLISENATNLVPDGGKNDQSKPVSIIERIINSITSISTTTKPGEEKDGASTKGVTESSAILKIASKKPTLEQTTTKVAEVTTEKPTTIIERILSSLSAIQATDHVGTTESMLKALSPKHGGTLGQLLNLLKPKPKQTTTEAPQPYSTVAISLADYIASLGAPKSTTLLPTTFYDVSDLVNSLSISPGTIPPSFANTVSLSADFNPSTVSSLDFTDFLEINNPTEINIVDNRINVPTTTETPITTTNPPATTVEANPTTTPEPTPEVTTKSEISTTPIPTEKVTTESTKLSTEIPMESSTEIITEMNTQQSAEILARFAEVKVEPTANAPVETTISPTMKAIVDLTTDAKVDSTTEMKLEALTDIKTESATEMKMDASTEMKVESTTEMKVEASTEMKVESSTEMKVESTTEMKVDASTEMKVESSTEMKVESTTEMKVDASTEIKVESTTEMNVEASTEMKSETSADMMKVESTTEMKVEPTTAAKIEEMKVETVTEVKAEAPIESRIAGEIKVESTTEAKVEASTDSGAMVESSSDMGVVESTTEQKLEQTTEVIKLDLKMASESPVTEMNPSTTPQAPISGTEMPEMTTIDLTANLIETEKPTTEAPLTTEQFKVSLSSVQITSGNEAVPNEEEATTVTIPNRGSFPQRMGKLLPDADVIQEQVTNDLVSPQPQAQPRPIAVPSTTTPRSRDYFIFAVLPNNTIVRKRPPMRQRAPFLIVGVYPNNTIVHKFPNGTIVPEEPVVQANDVAANQLSLDIGNSLEVPSPMTTTTTTTTTTSTPTTTMAATATTTTTTTSSPSTTTTTTLSPTMMAMSEMLTTTLTPETSSPTLTPTTTPTEDLTSLTGLLGGKTVEEFKTIVNQSNAAYTLAVNNDTLIVRTKNRKLVRRRRPIRREFLDVDDSVVSSRINTEDADNEINAAEAATTKAAEATTKVAEATTAAQAPTTQAATTTTTTMKTTTTTEAAKATEPAPITTTYRTTTINPYTTTDLATFISQFLSTLRPVYTPTTTYVPTTFAPTTPYISTTYNDNIIEDTAPTVTITARSRTTTRLTTQPPTTTPIPTTTPMPTTTTKRVTTTQPPTTTTMPSTTTTEAPTTTPMIRTTTTLPPTTTNIPSKRRLETTTAAPIRRRSTLPPTTTTYLPTTTYIPTTTFVPTTKLGVKPEDVDIDEIIKKSNKKLSDQQLKDLEALKALEREQAAILKQLSFLTNLNFGGQQQPKLTTKQPKLSTPSSLASRILSFAAERDKETTTTFRPPVETTTNPGVTIIEALSTSRQPKRIAAVDSKNEIESIIKQLNDNGVTSVTNPTIVSTYGKSQEAILAAILKERGIEPSTPKSLGDQIRQNHLFNEPTTTRRPRITTQRPPGRLAQGLNWILNALAPPPSTRRPKPKPRPKPVVVTTTEYEELIRESTDSTPVYAETTTRGKRPVNALSDAELANLIAQLEAIQKDPAKVRNLDLTPFKSLQNPTDQRTKNVEIISSSSSGSNKVTRAPKAYSGSQRIRASTINSIEEDPTTRPPRVVTTTQEVHTRPVTRGSRITLPPVSLDPVPGVNDNSPMVGGNFLNAAVNVTRAISTFLGSAIQGAAQSFQTMIGSGSRGVGGYFEGSRG